MRIVITFSMFFLFLFSAYSQSSNLLINGSFENYYTCPKGYTESYTRFFLPAWRMPTKGTPDYFNKCSKFDVGVPQNFMGSINPQHGEAYIGLVLLDTPSGVRKAINYREYIQAQLKQPLVIGQRYRVRFYYALAQNSTYSINRIGVFLSSLMVEAKKGVLSVKPQLEVDPLVFPSVQGEWIEFNQVFTAKGGERYITIGNFYPDSKTGYANNNIDGLHAVLQKKVLTNKIAYYYIDNVSVEALLNEESNEPIPFSSFRPFSLTPIDSVMKQSQLGTGFLLDEVYFNLSNPSLVPVSLLQGDYLVYVFKGNPSLKLNFAALACDKELTRENAKKRAELFIEYLEKHGIDGNRITFELLDLKAFDHLNSYYLDGVEVVLASKLIAIRIL